MVLYIDSNPDWSPVLNLGSGLDQAFEHRIFEDVHDILGGKWLAHCKFTIYQQSTDWFEVGIDVTIGGQGQHMIYVQWLQYDVPKRGCSTSLTVEKELSKTWIRAQLFNMNGSTEKLTEAKIAEIGKTFWLDVDNAWIITLNVPNSSTRRRVIELLSSSIK